MFLLGGWRAGVLRVVLHQQTREADFSCVGGEGGPGSERRRPGAAGLLGLGELLKAGFVGQQKVPGSRAHGRQTGPLTPEEALGSLATQVQQVQPWAWKYEGLIGGSSWAPSHGSALPSKAHWDSDSK